MILHKVVPSEKKKKKFHASKALQASMNNSSEFNIEIGHLFPCQSKAKADLQNALAANNESSRCFEMTPRASAIMCVLF